MEVYETEEQQVEALKRWWKENGQSTVSGVLVGIIIIVGWNFWQNYKKDRSLQASALYEQLLSAVGEGKTESAEKIAERINEKFEGVAYGAYADLLRAKVKVQQNDLPAAKAILEGVVEKADNELAHVARLRLIRILLAEGQYEQGLQKIAEVDSAAAGGFSGAYDELKGDLYVALDNPAEARTAYRSAQTSGYRSPLLQLKLDDLTEAEIVPAT